MALEVSLGDCVKKHCTHYTALKVCLDSCVKYAHNTGLGASLDGCVKCTHHTAASKASMGNCMKYTNHKAGQLCKVTPITQLEKPVWMVE